MTNTTNPSFLDTSIGPIEFKRVRPIAREVGTRGTKPPTIVLLHEGLGCVAMWRNFPQQLADATQYEVVLYSRPGYGHSTPRPKPTSCRFMHEEALDVLPEILDRAQLEQVILLGHSDGGSIATIYAGQRNDSRVMAVVLIAAHFFVEDLSIRAIERAARLFETTDLRIKLERYHPGQVDNMFAIWRDAWLAPQFRSWNLLTEVANLQVPVLALQGRDDEYGSERQISQLEQHYRGPALRTELLSDCRHAPHLEQPERTIELVSSFFEAYAS